MDVESMWPQGGVYGTNNWLGPNLHLYVPEHLHVFVRIATELPPLLECCGTTSHLWIGVNWPLLDRVVRIFLDSGWAVAGTCVDEAVSALPSALLEVTWTSIAPRLGD